MPRSPPQFLISPAAAAESLPPHCPFFTIAMNIAFYITISGVLYVLCLLLNCCFRQNRSQASAGRATVPITRLREHRADPGSHHTNVIPPQQPHQRLSSNDPVSQTATTSSDLKNFLQPCTFGSIAGVARECAVCLSNFETNDLVRRLPVCCHVFHAPCIDTWLTAKDTCPLCRSTVKPSEMGNVVGKSILGVNINGQIGL